MLAKLIESIILDRIFQISTNFVGITSCKGIIIYVVTEHKPTFIGWKKVCKSLITAKLHCCKPSLFTVNVSCICSDCEQLIKSWSWKLVFTNQFVTSRSPSKVVTKKSRFTVFYNELNFLICCLSISISLEFAPTNLN